MISSATNAAMLLATSYRQSNQILAMRNSYHGRSFASVAIDTTIRFQDGRTSRIKTTVAVREIPREGETRDG